MARPLPLESDLFLKGEKPRASRANGTPDFIGGRPKCPKHLSSVARKEFKRMCRELMNRGSATKIDGAILELYAETYARARACREEIGDKWFVDIPVTDSNGQIVWKRGANPATATLEKAESLLTKLLTQLGATPNSRQLRQLTMQGKKKNAPALPGSVRALLESEGE